MHVLGIRDQCRAAERLQGSSPVDRRGSDADRLAEPIAGHLNRPVKHLLDRPCGVLDPALAGALAEELGRLDYRDSRIVQIREQLGEKVEAGREIGVQDDQELARRPSEGIAEVAGLLAGRAVRSPNVGESEGLRAVARLVGPTVVQDIRLCSAWIADD